MATQSSILAWRSLWTEEPDRLCLMCMNELMRFIYLELLLTIVLFLNKISILGSPWWLSDEKSVCQWREHEFNPWYRKILHGAGKRSPRATTTEPVLRAMSQTTEPTSHNSEACMPRVCTPQEKPLQWEAHALQLEKACMQQ